MRLSAFCLLFTCFFFVITACHDDNALKTTNIEGVWKEEMLVDEFNIISRLEYTFQEGGRVQVLRIEIDKDSQEILGYRHKMTGNYVQSGNKLSFYNLTEYSNDDSKELYAELEDLIKQSEGGSYNITFEIQEDVDGESLTFFYPSCGQLANCIATQTLRKTI